MRGTNPSNALPAKQVRGTHVGPEPHEGAKCVSRLASPRLPRLQSGLQALNLPLHLPQPKYQRLILVKQHCRRLCVQWGAESHGSARRGAVAPREARRRSWRRKPGPSHALSPQMSPRRSASPILSPCARPSRGASPRPLPGPNGTESSPLGAWPPAPPPAAAGSASVTSRPTSGQWDSEGGGSAPSPPHAARCRESKHRGAAELPPVAPGRGGHRQPPAGRSALRGSDAQSTPRGRRAPARACIPGVIHGDSPRLYCLVTGPDLGFALVDAS